MISNKAKLGFIFITKLDLLKLLADKINSSKTYSDITDVIAFIQINLKFHYNNKKYQPKILAVGDYTLLWLYKDYNILFILNQKLDQ